MIEILLILILILLFVILHKINELLKPTPGLEEWNVKTVEFKNLKIKIKGVLIMTTAKVDQVFHLDWPGPKDKYGNPATVQGEASFSSDDEEVATIEPAPERSPYSAKVTTKQSVGSTMLRIKADANLTDDGDTTTGDDVKEIEGTHSVEVLSGEATGFLEPTATEPADNPDTEE